MNTTQEGQWSIFQHELRNFVLKRVKDKASADDIVQDVFVKVYTNIDRLKDSDKLSAWIYQITRNTIADYFRSRTKTLAQEDLSWNDSSNDLNGCVAVCLAKLTNTLPDIYREALQLAEMENLSQLQLAERLGISYSGAKSRVQRARQLLKKKMEEQLIVKTDGYGNVLVCEDRNPCCRQPCQN